MDVFDSLRRLAVGVYWPSFVAWVLIGIAAIVVWFALGSAFIEMATARPAACGSMTAHDCAALMDARAARGLR